jgi:hypothetical protein
MKAIRREHTLPPISLGGAQHTITTKLDILVLQSTVLTGIMCLHALLCVYMHYYVSTYMSLTNTNVKELEVKKEQRLNLLII